MSRWLIRALIIGLLGLFVSLSWLFYRHGFSGVMALLPVALVMAKNKLVMLFDLYIIQMLWRDLLLVFVSGLTVKKAFLMGIVGLAKRYLIENVIIASIRRYYLDELKEPMSELLDYFKALWLRARLLHKALLLIPASIAGYVAWVLGYVGTLIENALTAKIWSALLSFITKLSAGMAYFFGDYLWNAWVVPILEVFILTYILNLIARLKPLHRFPRIRRFLRKRRVRLTRLVRRISALLERFVYAPVRNSLGFSARKTETLIYKVTRKPVGPIKKYEYEKEPEGDTDQDVDRPA